MSDEKFEEFLQREAKAYNEPPASVPRDEMWAALSQARAARPAAVAGAGTSRTAGRPSHGVRRYAPWIGMAATLLVGVGIGRFALQRDGVMPDGAAIPGPRVATTSSALPASGTDIDSVTGGAPDDPPAPRRLPAQNAPVHMVATTTTPAPGAATDAGSADDAALPATPTPYGVVSQRHLASAEALITVVTAAPRDAMMDSLTSRWAREMLSSTRLLLDSPAGDDPVRRRLLEDLETLLVQMVQRSGGAVDERDLIDRTLQRTQLLTRLRTNAAGT